MSSRFVAAIDQGTTGTRCAIFNGSGRLIGWSYKKHRQIYPREGFVEQDPIEVINNVRSVIKGAIKDAKIEGKQISALGVANQRETVVACDKRSGRPLYNAISWQDSRTKSFIDELRADEFSKTISGKTGLSISTYFSASKIRWMIDNVPKLRDKTETLWLET